MIAGASRIEGGAWVQAGFLLTYAAFAYGCVVVGAAVLGLRRARLEVTVPGVLATVFAVAAVGLLWLPAIEFPEETLSGFRGLDPLSVFSVVALAAVVVVGPMRAIAALCQTGVLAGNLLIQHFTTRESTDRYGLTLAVGAAAMALLCAALGVRGPLEPRR